MRFTPLAAFIAVLCPLNQGLSDEEQYLAPYAKELVQWKNSEIPALSRLVSLATDISFIPTWLESTFIPLFLPDGKTFDLNLALSIPNAPAVGKVDVVVQTVTLEHLGALKNLQLGLGSASDFTWHATVQLQDISITAEALVTLFDIPFNASVSLELQNLSLDIQGIVAFNRTRLCEVWGGVFLSSTSCALHPVMEKNGDVGLRITSLELGLDDFKFAMNLSNPDLIPSAKDALQDEVAQVVDYLKPELLANLSTKYSQMALEMGNEALMNQIPKFHAESPCTPDVWPTVGKLDPLVNVSQVCISNNGGYTMGFGFQDCPAHFVSPQTSRYPVDQYRCMDVHSAMPNAVDGEIVRVTTGAAAGLQEIVDPAFQYVPGSNAAAFECDGGTLTYGCKLISLVPVDPSVLPPVSRVCMINHGGFVMDFQAKNLRSQNSVAQSNSFPINQRKCVDLGGADVFEGDEIKLKAHAHWGKTNSADRKVKYSDNGLTASYECKGTTLNFQCKLLVSGASDLTTSVV